MCLPKFICFCRKLVIWINLIIRRCWRSCTERKRIWSSSNRSRRVWVVMRKGNRWRIRCCYNQVSHPPITLALTLVPILTIRMWIWMLIAKEYWLKSMKINPILIPIPTLIKPSNNVRNRMIISISKIIKTTMALILMTGFSNKVRK